MCVDSFNVCKQSNSCFLLVCLFDCLLPGFGQSHDHFGQSVQLDHVLLRSEGEQKQYLQGTQTFYKHFSCHVPITKHQDTRYGLGQILIDLFFVGCVLSDHCCFIPIDQYGGRLCARFRVQRYSDRASIFRGLVGYLHRLMRCVSPAVVNGHCGNYH